MNAKDPATATPRGYVALVQAIKTILVTSIGSAVSLGTLWWMINGIYRVNGVGWLTRMGWPFDSVILCAASGAVGGAFLGWVRFRRQARHRVDLAALSDELDFHFDPQRGEFQPPPMPVFENLASVDDRMSRVREGVHVDVFDLTTVVKSDEGSRTQRRTIVLLPAANLPNFQLKAKTLGYQFLDWIGASGITFDPAAGKTEADRIAIERFGRYYLLEAGDTTDLAAGTPEIFTEIDRAVRTHFSLEVVKQLAARPGWSIQSHGEHLAFWRGPGVRPASERLRFVASAMALRNALLRPCDAASVIPPLPGADRSRQSARYQGALLGGVIGLFGSFFLAFVVCITLLFGRDIREPGFPTQLLLFPLIVVLGTIGGIFIGSRLPITKPLLTKPKNPKHEKRVGCAILFGLIGGFFGGAIAGAILGFLFDNPAAMPALFFGGSGVGAIAGPILCGMTANAILRRWQTVPPEVPPTE